MELDENKYFESIMIRYFELLIDMNLYQYRNNLFHIYEYKNQDKALGYYESMKEIASFENVLCVNFDPNFPVQEEIEGLNFINTELGLKEYPCDYLFIYNKVDKITYSRLINYYNPKFIIGTMY